MNLFTPMRDDLNYFLSQYLQYYSFLIPLGIIGIWRWTVWAIKRIVAFQYKPQKNKYSTSVSIVTPVYNENPEVFLKALNSWKKNKPEEIIAVIDYTDKVCIQIFNTFAQENPEAKLIVTKIPGKREALATGIRRAKGTILALVDSDTIWTDDVVKNGIMPFKDPRIGGVATRQSILNPQTLAQKLFSIRLEQRYWDDIPFSSKAMGILICLSGRTAFYRRSTILPLLKELTTETFMGEKVISGEDKRLTYLIEERGWKTTYQSSSHVYTIGERNLSTLMNQQIRWTRNSWRSDLKALYQGWVFRHPLFAAYLIDRAVAPFTLLISPIYFLVSIYFHLWIPVAVILVWWMVSRTIKMYPHLRHHPQDIFLLPAFILFSFASAFTRIYALVTINVQGWITRWNKGRLPVFNSVRIVLGYLSAAMIFLLIATAVFIRKNQTYYIPHQNQLALLAKSLPEKIDAAPLEAATAEAQRLPNLITSRYEFQFGDWLEGIAEKFDVPLEKLVQANGNKITQWSLIDPGVNLTIPSKEQELIPYQRFNYYRVYPDFLSIYYNPDLDQIRVSGRGKITTLADIAQAVGPEYLEEVAPEVWYLKTNLYLASGVTLKLRKEEVNWLRLKSDSDKYIMILGYNCDLLIEGTRISSWDSKHNGYDTNTADGRSFILIKDNSRMDVINSEISYLGFPRPADSPYSTYGISWRMSTGNLGKYLLTGEVMDSKFHHNYFGAYTFGATGMTWRGNEFFENIRYGLDPHDDSNGFLVEKNVFRDNGSHGLIFSKRCIYNQILNNVSFHNKLHGIMLHELSDKNLIENNTIYENKADGIALDHSSGNIVQNNTILRNNQGIRASRESQQNILKHNTITASSQYGIYLYEQSKRNRIEANHVTQGAYALYIKSSNNYINNNILSHNVVGIYLLDTASQNVLSKNRISYNTRYGVYSKVTDRSSNAFEHNNFLYRNQRDLAAERIN